MNASSSLSGTSWRPGDSNEAPQQLAQVADRPIHRRTVAASRQYRQRVERVEQEVRADLGLQAVEPGGGQAALEPGGRDRAFGRLAPRLDQQHHQRRSRRKRSPPCRRRRRRCGRRAARSGSRRDSAIMWWKPIQDEEVDGHEHTPPPPDSGRRASPGTLPARTGKRAGHERAPGRGDHDACHPQRDHPVDETEEQSRAALEDRASS